MNDKKPKVKYLLAYVGPSTAITDYLGAVTAYRRNPAAFKALYEAMREVLIKEEGQKRLL